MKRSGFTLMEMLLVTALVALIGLSVFNAFSNGLKLWARGVALDHEGDVRIWLEKMGDDLRSTLPLTEIPFKGTADRLSFCSLLWTPADRNSSRASEGTVDQIGAVEYRYDYAYGKVLRRQATYGQAFRGTWGEEQEVVSGVEELKFVYYFSKNPGMEEKARTDGQRPMGVLVSVRLKGQNAPRELVQYFAIPVGG